MMMIGFRLFCKNTRNNHEYCDYDDDDYDDEDDDDYDGDDDDDNDDDEDDDYDDDEDEEEQEEDAYDDDDDDDDNDNDEDDEYDDDEDDDLKNTITITMLIKVTYHLSTNHHQRFAVRAYVDPLVLVLDFLHPKATPNKHSRGFITSFEC